MFIRDTNTGRMTYVSQTAVRQQAEHIELGHRVLRALFDENNTARNVRLMAIKVR